jgi:hypothetical protein
VKKISFLAVSVVLILASCIKHDTPGTPLNDTIDTTVADDQGTGIFMNGPYGSASGRAVIYSAGNSYTLALENVSISNGPDLHVYLSKERIPVNFIDLGRLQSVAGNQLYPIPGQPDFSQYKYALIHCQRFNHLLGSAELR